jgi:hypothetical protein
MSITPRVERKQLRKQKSADITYIDHVKKLSTQEKASININIDDFEKTDVVDDAYVLQERSRNQV